MFRGLLVLAIGLLVPLWSVSAQDRWVLLGSRDIEPSASEASIDLDAAHPVKQLRLVERRVASRFPRWSSATEMVERTPKSAGSIFWRASERNPSVRARKLAFADRRRACL